MKKSSKTENQKETDLSKSDLQGYNISLCIKQGKKSDQQDSGFVGILPNSDEEKNSEEILRQAIKKAESNHKECLKGTTICSAIISNQSIVVANLGDSRAAGIFRTKGFFGDRFVSVLFSQDHDFSVPRVRKYVEERGGKISFDHGIEVVNGKLEMGGAIFSKISA
jgi:serine/threonine protein phosphatase PrpC